MTASSLNDIFKNDVEVDLERMQSDRQQKLTQAMAVADVDALILRDPLNVEYAGEVGAVSGGHRPATIVFTADGKQQRFDAPAPAEGASAFEGYDPTMGEVAEFLRSEGCGRIACDQLDTMALQAVQWGLGHPTRALVGDGGAGIVALARSVKTPDEIECIRRSQYLLELCMDEMLPLVKPGTEYETLKNVLSQFFTELDPVGDVLTTIEGPATTGAILIWHTATETAFNVAGEPSFPILPFPMGPLAEGDVAWVDTTLRYYGLEGDWGRTWTVGEPSAKAREQHKRWRDVQDAVVDVFRPGKTAADALAAAVAATGDAKTQPWVNHLYLIHGIGLFPAEYPLVGVDRHGWYYRNLMGLGMRPASSTIDAPATSWLPRDDELVFEPGMVLVAEPVIWDVEDGTGGYRAEDIYVVSDGGEPQLLSHASFAPFE
jgi:Xaa-Pro aminopeptidase